MRQDYKFQDLTNEQLSEKLRNAGKRYRPEVIEALFNEVDRRLEEWRQSIRKQEEKISVGVDATGEGAIAL